MDTRIETIDKDKASEYLSHNMVNRKLSQGRVSQYADSLARGDWQLNGESIKFNDKGEMIDGQHRLNAIIKSGVPMLTVVVYGISDDVSVMDRGRNRSVTDALLVEGFDKSIATNTCVAMAKLHYRTQIGSSNCSDSFVRKFIEENAEVLLRLNAILGRGSSKSSHRQLVKNAPMELALFYALNVEVPWEEIEEFISIIKTGFYENRKQTSAIVLRNDLIGQIVGARAGGERVYATYAIEKAIYDFHHGNERKQSYKNINKPTYSNNIKFAIQR